MKRNFYLAALLCAFLSVNAQVGINTDEPEATLDVNGNVKIRDVKDADAAATDYNFLVVDADNTVKKVNGNLSDGTAGTSSVAAGIAKAEKKNGLTLLDLGAFNQWQKMDFKEADLAINPGNYFDADTDMYVVPSDGIYEISFDVRYGSGVAASLLNFNGIPRIGILKHNEGGGYSVLDEKEFSGVNVSLGEIDLRPILPPFTLGLLSVVISNTSINTVYELSEGDRLSFELDKGGVDLSLLGSGRATVTIHKISEL